MCHVFTLLTVTAPPPSSSPANCKRRQNVGEVHSPTSISLIISMNNHTMSKLICIAAILLSHSHHVALSFPILSLRSRSATASSLTTKRRTSRIITSTSRRRRAVSSWGIRSTRINSSQIVCSSSSQALSATTSDDVVELQYSEFLPPSGEPSHPPVM